MIEMANEVLPKRKCAEWLLSALRLQEKQLLRLEQEIADFNKEFSFTEPEKAASVPREVLNRAIQKLTGKSLTGKP
jgi:DNA-directed RNA polymerase subunit F